jgi:apolipoprotein N-acyltransferase
MDFPSIPLALAQAGAGLVALPSSDWRGIDPLHSDMARIMGIATGMSVLRSVRSDTSMASDPYGRVRASRRFYEEGDGVMLADLPAVPVPTLYAQIGDVFPVANVAFSLVMLLALSWTSFRHRRKPAPRA